MKPEPRGYDITEFPELRDPEGTIREALRDTIGDGEGIDHAVLARFIAKVKADALRETALELTQVNTRAGVAYPTRDSIQVRAMADRIEEEA